MPHLLFNNPHLFFTKPFDEEKVFNILLAERRTAVIYELERIDQEMKSLEFEKSQLQNYIYKRV